MKLSDNIWPKLPLGRKTILLRALVSIYSFLKPCSAVATGKKCKETSEHFLVTASQTKSTDGMMQATAIHTDARESNISD